ncbi:MAG: peptidoglycan DD-metalloendopeptidase family protein [Novosphingobium sp.]
MGSKPRLAFALLLPLAALIAVAAQGQAVFGVSNVGDARRALAEAQEQGEGARTRAEKLEAEAARVTEAAEKTARAAAAIAARIQETEAEIAEHEARVALLGRERAELRARLAERQQPVVRLTAALQRLSRRPPALALLRPGSVRDTMHMRALLATMLPEVESRTAALKLEIERARALERRAQVAARDLRKSEAELQARRQSLAAIETRQRLASRRAAGTASREADRALALAEKARDLGDLVDELGRAGELREQLADLPGPIMRPPRPEDSQVVVIEQSPASSEGLSSYMLPVSGRLTTGFGEAADGPARSQGIALATRAGAQVVAPASGRVAFAGPYRGYGSIVIIEHPGGWTTLVTGLARLDTRVGEELVSGSPLGITGAGEPEVTLELRREGEPVNPLQYVTPL